MVCFLLIFSYRGMRKVKGVMFFDMQYMILVMLPALVLAGIASLMVKVTFNRYSRVRCYSGLTGAQAAERMLRTSGVFDVKVEETGAEANSLSELPPPPPEVNIVI